MANFSKVTLARIEEAVRVGYIYLLPCPAHIPFEKRHVLFNAQARSFIRAQGDIDLPKYERYARRGKFYMMANNVAIYKEDDRYFAYAPGQPVYESDSYDDVLLHINGNAQGEFLVLLTAAEINTLLIALDRIDSDKALVNKLTNVLRK